jgi:hypothetical protein
MTTQHYVVRANKGRARIWLEGKRLMVAGFAVGARFTIDVIEGALVLRLDLNGSRKVSGKGERPIIDISGGSCDPFITGDAVQVDYIAEHSIVITGAHDDG